MKCFIILVEGRSLKITRYSIGYQCSLIRTGVICSDFFFASVMIRAAEFCGL